MTKNVASYDNLALGRVSEVQFCTTKRLQFCEFEVTSCRRCSLRSKKAFLEIAMYNLQGFVQRWGPCIPI